MSTTPISTSAQLASLASAITQKFDQNRDGKLSADEFGGFLKQLLPDSLKAVAAPTAATTTTNSSVTRLGTMAGFSEDKLADASHVTTKYVVGRILQRYPNTAEGLRAALPEIQQAIPGATISGSKGDLLNFGDYRDRDGLRIGIVDVLQAAGTGGKAWQWMPTT